MSDFYRCNDRRECFAKSNGKCTLLETVFPDGQCPFCKPERLYTNGVHYPYHYPVNPYNPQDNK